MGVLTFQQKGEERWCWGIINQSEFLLLLRWIVRDVASSCSNAERAHAVLALRSRGCIDLFSKTVSQRVRNWLNTLYYSIKQWVTQHISVKNKLKNRSCVLTCWRRWGVCFHAGLEQARQIETVGYYGRAGITLLDLLNTGIYTTNLLCVLIRVRSLPDVRNIRSHFVYVPRWKNVLVVWMYARQCWISGEWTCQANERMYDIRRPSS